VVNRLLDDRDTWSAAISQRLPGVLQASKAQFDEMFRRLTAALPDDRPEQK
jgi:hypothetical protein